MSGQPAFARPPPFQSELLREIARQSTGSEVRRDQSLRHESGTAVAGSSTSATTTTHKRKREETQQPHSSPPNANQGDDVRRASYKRVATGNNNDNHSGMTAKDTASESHGDDLTVQPGNSFTSEHTSPSQQGEAGDEEEMHDRRASATSIEFNSIGHQHHSSEDNNETNDHHNSDEAHSAQQNGASNPSNATSTAAAALAGMFPNMTVPQPTFGGSASARDTDRNLDPSFGVGDNEGGQHPHGLPDFNLEEIARRGGLPQIPPIPAPPSAGGVSASSKPVVGSEEWHRVRRDNHKEVERRRRETINEGINELAKIVPGCEKNKGSILQRAVSFITQLKENEAQNIEKWTLEKLLTEQAITELSASNDKYKSECERAWREAEHWKKMCEEAGLISPKGDAGATDDNGTKDDGA